MFIRYVIAMAIAVLAIVIAVILGDYGPWYLSWFLGTGFMVLVAASAGVLFEAQEDARQEADADVSEKLVEIVTGAGGSDGRG